MQGVPVTILAGRRWETRSPRAPSAAGRSPAHQCTNERRAERWQAGTGARPPGVRWPSGPASSRRSTRTGKAHWLTKGALDAGRRSRGRYIAVCGTDVLAHRIDNAVRFSAEPRNGRKASERQCTISVVTRPYVYVFEVVVRRDRGPQSGGGGLRPGRRLRIRAHIFLLQVTRAVRFWVAHQTAPFPAFPDRQAAPGAGRAQRG